MALWRLLIRVSRPWRRPSSSMPGKCVLGHGQGGGRRDGPRDFHDESADESARVPGEPFRVEAGLVSQRDRRLGGGRFSPVALQPVNRELDKAGPWIRLAGLGNGMQRRGDCPEELFPRFRGDPVRRFEERGGDIVVSPQETKPERPVYHRCSAGRRTCRGPGIRSSGPVPPPAGVPQPASLRSGAGRPRRRYSGSGRLRPGGRVRYRVT